jgi:hypothetical protein
MGWLRRGTGWPCGGVTAHNQGFNGTPACAGMRRSSTGSTRAGAGRKVAAPPSASDEVHGAVAGRRAIALAGGLAANAAGGAEMERLSATVRPEDARARSCPESEVRLNSQLAP